MSSLVRASLVRSSEQVELPTKSQLPNSSILLSKSEITIFNLAIPLNAKTSNRGLRTKLAEKYFLLKNWLGVLLIFKISVMY